jgi:hypothetical protein
VILTGGCTTTEAPPLTEHQFAFGVFGDGPYTERDARKYGHFLEDVGRAGIEWLLHVGDILWYPCSDEAFRDRLASFNSIEHPVIYTPGDNEWADCHTTRAGGYEPLDRLASIRRIFFADPGQSVGGVRLPLETQSDNPRFAVNVENVRWRKGGFVFATLHMVGGGNALDAFPGRTAANDLDVAQRTEAALAWMQAAFDIARADSLHGVVLALHGNPGLERDPEAWNGYTDFVARLARLTASFPGQVVLIHGDTHTFRVDHPLIGPSGRALVNFTRIETYGSPDIGWVRVVIDSTRGELVDFQPRRFSVFR